MLSKRTKAAKRFFNCQRSPLPTMQRQTKDEAIAMAGEVAREESYRQFRETLLEIKAPEKVDWLKLATEICVDPQRYLRKEFAVPQSYVIRVYRDSLLLHSATYQTSQIEDARAYAKGFYAWDRIERVELLLPNGATEEIANP